MSRNQLEIKCKVTVEVPNATSRQVAERYRTLVEKLYVEPKEEKILDSFILNTDKEFSINQRSTRTRKQLNKSNETTAKSKDLIKFIHKERSVVVLTEKKSL